MRKVLMALIAAVALLAAAQMARAADLDIKDMHRGHWAYDSVQMLVQKGYLALYDDGTFRGNLPLSREVFATALAKLIDQINNGEIGMGSMDMGEIKKLSDAFKDEISNYETRVKALEKKISELNDTISVDQKDLTKAMVEYREGFEAVQDDNKKMRAEIGVLTEQVKDLNAGLAKETKARKSSQTIMFIGIIAAIAVGASSN